MSIINDALKKAAKDKHPFQNRPQQILSKIDEIKTDARKYILRRCLFWTGAAVACILGVILTNNYLRDFSESDLAKETSSYPEVADDVFSLREVDLKPSVNISDFYLSGIIYDNQKPLAIINDHIVAEGSLINGAKLLEIRPDIVRLSREGEEFTLKIK